MEEDFPVVPKLTARLTDHLGHDISSVQLYIGLTGLLYYVCTTVVTVVGTTFLIETTAHLTALAHLCFTGSALVITLFIIVGATFFLLRQLVSLQRQLIHVSMGQFVCILFSLPVFEITFLIGTGCPFYVVGSFFLYWTSSLWWGT